MTKILVTGATGTVGSKTVKALVEAGLEVRAGVRDPRKATSLGAGAEVVRLDFEDAQSLEAAMKGVDRVFLLTPFVEDAKPLVRAAIDAAKSAGVSFIVRMSALGADPRSDFKLAQEHGLAEAMVKESGIDWCVVRPGFFMDNLVHFQGQSIRAQAQFYGSSGGGASAYVDTRDVASAAAAILKDRSGHVGQTYVLTGPKAVTDAEVAETISAAIGKEVRYVDLPNEAFAGGLKQQGTPAWLVEALLGLETVKANGWAAEVSPAVESITGTPARALDSFVADNAAAWR